jgi:hypothetical protein
MVETLVFWPSGRAAGRTMNDWPRSPITGRVVLGAAAGRTTFDETIERTDARLRELRRLRRRVGSLLVGHLDRLATGAPVEQVAAELVRAVESFTGGGDVDGE